MYEAIHELVDVVLMHVASMLGAATGTVISLILSVVVCLPIMVAIFWLEDKLIAKYQKHIAVKAFNFIACLATFWGAQYAFWVGVIKFFDK